MSLDTWLWTAALTIFMFGGRYASLAAFILVLLGLVRPLHRLEAKSENGVWRSSFSDLDLGNRAGPAYPG